MELKEFQDAMNAVATGLEAHRRTFTALGDENRQRILLELLRNYGGLRVNEIAEAINLSRPATSHHLKTLREAGLVDMYERGTMNFYHATSSAAEWADIARVAEAISKLCGQCTHRTRDQIAAAQRDT